MASLLKGIYDIPSKRASLVSLNMSVVAVNVVGGKRVFRGDADGIEAGDRSGVDAGGFGIRSGRWMFSTAIVGSCL